MGGDNPSSAGNQQERPITPDWVVGFVDGEGCFSIGLVRQDGGGQRKGYRTGFQLAPRFAVVQGERSQSALMALRDFFGVGSLYTNRRHDNHREDLIRYDVSRLDDLRDVIIPFFQQHPLQTAKQHDFECFAAIVQIMAARIHLEREGLITVLKLMELMNHRKSREDVIGILRGHTPDVPQRARVVAWMMRWSHLHGDMQELPLRHGSSVLKRESYSVAIR